MLTFLPSKKLLWQSTRRRARVRAAPVSQLALRRRRGRTKRSFPLRRSSRCLKRRRRCSLVVLWFTSHRRREARGHCRLLPSQTKSQFSEEALNRRACSAILPGCGCHPVLLLLLVLLCAPKVGIGFLLPGFRFSLLVLIAKRIR